MLWISLPGEAAAATKYKASARNTVKPYVLQLTQHIGKSLIYISAHIVTHIPIHLQTIVNLNICIPPYSWPRLDLRHAPVLNTYCRMVARDCNMHVGLYGKLITMRCSFRWFKFFRYILHRTYIVIIGMCAICTVVKLHFCKQKIPQ